MVNLMGAIVILLFVVASSGLAWGLMHGDLYTAAGCAAVLIIFAFLIARDQAGGGHD